MVSAGDIEIFKKAYLESIEDLKNPRKNWKSVILVIWAFIWPLLFLQATLISELLVGSQTETVYFEIPNSNIFYNNNMYQLDLEELNENVIVPDYGAKIKINKPNQIVKDDSIEFSISVFEDNVAGVEFEKPYYYIIIMDPDDEQRYIFPTGNEKYSTSNLYGITYGNDRKPIEWKGEGGKTCKEDLVYLVDANGDTRCLNREELMAGNITFKAKLDKIGDWKIYVLLYDEEYSPRNGITSEEANNAIIIEGPEIINVTTTEENTQTFLDYLTELGKRLTYSVILLALILSRSKDEKEKAFWWIIALSLWVGLLNKGIIPPI